ncbi:hypothetical protein E6H23_00210 [Candidatus Bathyarchaeota archaeon]|nr:MAG: hypothetical protein E6H23_00210 [Candidatus Bathyarchaeota archaeon]
MSIPHSNPSRNPRVFFRKNVKKDPSTSGPIQKKGARSTRVPRHKTLIPAIHEENSPEKSFYRHFLELPLRIVIDPHPSLFFSSHTEPATAFLIEQTPSKARVHVPIVDRHCSTLVLDTINTIPSKHDHHPLKDQDPY